MSVYRISPNLREVSILAEFTTPVSHHDPARQDDSNINMFLRRKLVLDRRFTTLPTPDEITYLTQQFPVPTSLAHTINTLNAPQFLAVVMLREFIDAYATGEGIGLFAGIERYRRLDNRAVQQAVKAQSIFSWWGGLANAMQVGVSLRGDRPERYNLLAMPTALAQLALRELVENSASVMMLARAWHGASNELTSVPDLQPFALPEENKTVVEAPAISANSIRHEMVREPAMWHMLNILGVDLNELSDGMAALLYNGGDLNSSAPSTAFKDARTIIDAYPSLGLLGGSTKGYVLGASNLEVSAWLVAKEYTTALERYGIEPSVSVFDLVDRDEHTRHTQKRVEGSPMPFGFETLAAGSQVLISLRLRPYANVLQAGALGAAISTYLAGDSTLGGAAARGYGNLVVKDLQCGFEIFDNQAAYEEYLQSSADTLRHGLMDDSLTTGKVVV